MRRTLERTDWTTERERRAADMSGEVWWEVGVSSMAEEL